MNQFEKIVCEIENDQAFRNSSFVIIKHYGTKFEQIIKNIEPLHFQRWLRIIRTDFIDKHYANFDLHSLRMIVLGSNGMKNFNSKLAFIAEDGVASKEFRGSAPIEVKSLIELINESLGLSSERRDTEYDYFSEYSKKSTLYLNICFSNYCEDWIYLICMIRFVNKLLCKATEQGLTVAILDMRSSKHIHQYDLSISSQNLSITNCDTNYDDDLSMNEFDCQLDPMFRIEHCTYGHYYVRLGKRDVNAFEVNQMMNAIKQLEAKQFEISHLYIVDPFKVKTKIQKHKRPNEDSVIEDLKRINYCDYDIGANYIDENECDSFDQTEFNRQTIESVSIQTDQFLSNIPMNAEAIDENNFTFDYFRITEKCFIDQKSSIIRSECKAKFDSFIKKRLSQNECQRSVQTLRLLLTLTAKYKWQVRYVTFGDKRKMVNAITCQDGFFQSLIDHNLYIGQHCVLIETFMELDRFLGIQIEFDAMRKCYLLSQSELIENLAKKYLINTANISARKPIACSIDILDRDFSTTEKPVCELLKDLLDISNKTRPDICASVSILYNYAHRPSESLWKFTQQILKYLVQSKSTKLKLQPIGDLICYTDGSGLNRPNFKVTKSRSQSDVKTEIKLSSSKSAKQSLSSSNVINQFNSTRNFDEEFDFLDENEIKNLHSIDELYDTISIGSSCLLIDKLSTTSDLSRATCDIHVIESSVTPNEFEPFLEHSLNCILDRVKRCQTGYLLQSYQCAILWASEHVTIDAIEECDTAWIELVGAARSAAEIYIMKLLLKELGFENMERTEIFVDNQIVINEIVSIRESLLEVKNNNNNEVSRVVCLKKNIKDDNGHVKGVIELPQLDEHLHTLLLLSLRDVELVYVQSRSNTADLFTKIVPKNFDDIRYLLDLVD